MRVLWLTVVLSLFIAEAWAEEKEPTAIVELGTAGEWHFPSGKLGPTAAVEFTPIKDWLEIEAGVSMLFGGGQREWSTDLLFKKPFTLSDKVEFMFGVGPEWTFSRDGTKVAGEIGRRRIGSSDGFWSRATATLSAKGTNNRLARASACSSQFPDVRASRQHIGIRHVGLQSSRATSCEMG